MALEEQAIKVLDESASDADSTLVDQLVEEFPTLAGSLVKTINRRNKTNLEIPKKQRISKNKILLDITSTLSKINGELTIVNSRLVAQNDLLRANLGFTSNTIGNLEYNDSLLASKLDSVLEALKLQNEFAREKEEDEERDDIESAGEDSVDTAWSEGFKKGHKKGSPVGGLVKELILDRVRNFFIKRIFRFFTKRGMLNVLDKAKSKLGWKTARRGFEHIALNPKQDKFVKPKWWQAINEHIKPITKPLTSKIDDIASSRWGKGLIQTLNAPGDWLKKSKMGKHLQNLPWQKIGNRLSRRMPLITARFSGKMIPFAGSAISFAEATERAKDGDNFGAWLASIGGTSDFASMFTSPATATGVGAVVPGLLQAVSMGADITLLFYDIVRAFTMPLESEMEHGGVIQAPPILTPAEKGAVIGGNGPSDIGHIVNAASMITDTFGVNLSGTSKLRTQYPTDGSTGVVTLNPILGSQPLQDDIKSNDSEIKEIESTVDTNNTIESNDNAQASIDYQESKGDVLLSSNETKKDFNIASNNDVNVSSITPVTQSNNISDNISVNVDPAVKTKVIFVTRTIASGGDVIASGGGGGGNVEVKVYNTHHKLSRLILAS